MFRVEFRNEVLCALGKTVRTNLQILRYFQEKTVWAQFPASFHIYKCTKITNGDIYSSCLAPSLCQNVCLSMLISPHQNHVYWPSPLCWTVPQTCWGPVSCAIVLILLPIKFNLQLSCCAFFFLFSIDTSHQLCVIEHKSVYPNTQWGQANQNIRIWSRHSLITRSSKENDGWCQKIWTLQWLSGRVFKGNIWGEGCRGVIFLWLIGGVPQIMCSVLSYHSLYWVGL